MVEYLSGNRIRGTTAERPNLGLPSGSVGGWVELGRTTLGSAGDTISVSSLPNKRYYQVLFHASPTSTANQQIKFNNSSSGYARRGSEDGGGDFTSINQTHLNFSSGSNTYDRFHNYYISNLSSKEKLLIGQVVDNSGNGAGNAPSRLEGVGKWANTSSAFNRIDFTNTNAGSAFPSGTECVVLGYDPDSDTHTTNFWEELASVELTSTNTVLDSGTFTAKRYLWIELFAKANTSLTSIGGRYNGDTGNNYANRYSDNGGTDGTNTSQPIHTWTLGGNLASGETQFTNVFVINNASNEKLSICNTVEKGTSGAGTAPTRRETVGKWANTTDQITQVQLVRTNTTGDFASGSFIKVWGSN